MNKTKLFVGVGVLGFVLLGIIGSQFIGFAEIKGRQAAVVERFYNVGGEKGVEKHLLKSGRHFFVPMLSRPYVYNIGTEKFIMGHSNLYNGKGSEYVDYPAFTVTTGGKGKEQPATFSVTLQYHLDPQKLRNLHMRSGKDYEDLIIKPALTRIISDQATKLTVLEFYSGDGRVKLQKSIEKAITNHPKLSDVGIIVETFVFDQIKLDGDFVNEITGRQLATQKKLREREEALAAVETAKKVKAQAQAEKEKKIVAAEAKKRERVLAAQAGEEEVKARARADRFKKEQNAIALKKEGLAQAAVDKARKMSRYAGVAGQRQASVEIAKFNVEKFKNFNPQGVVTEKTFLSINSESKSPVVTIEANK